MKIKWFACAINDLSEIRKYIAEDNPTAAQNVASKIKEATSLLKEHSAAGRSGRIEGTRELVIPEFPYIIPYRVRNGEIEILRVLHNARKWPGKSD